MNSPLIPDLAKGMPRRPAISESSISDPLSVGSPFRASNQPAGLGSAQSSLRSVILNSRDSWWVGHSCRNSVIEPSVDRRMHSSLPGRSCLTITMTQVQREWLLRGLTCQRTAFWPLESVQSFQQKKLRYFQIGILVAAPARHGNPRKLIPDILTFAPDPFLNKLFWACMQQRAESLRCRAAISWHFSAFPFIMKVLPTMLILPQ
jgi:hypothetical protein